MNVVDGEALRHTAIDPALTRLHEETIPGLQSALDACVDRAVASASAGLAGIITGVFTGLDGLAEKLKGDVTTMLDRVAALEGYEAEITIRVRLVKTAGSFPAPISPSGPPVLAKGVE